MKWITRRNAKVDRIACPWLIKHFVDKDAEFLFVSAEDVMKVAKTENAIPFDTSGAELFHFMDKDYEYVTFDSIIRKYRIEDSALNCLAGIVRGADARIPDAPAKSAGLDIGGYIKSTAVGDPAETVRIVFENLPFPAIIGRVCTHMCEDICVLYDEGGPIAIRHLKRFAADKFDDYSQIIKVPKKNFLNKKVAVIGGGPTGLTLAYYLLSKAYILQEIKCMNNTDRVTSGGTSHPWLVVAYS